MNQGKEERPSLDSELQQWDGRKEYDFQTSKAYGDQSAGTEKVEHVYLQSMYC